MRKILSIAVAAGLLATGTTLAMAATSGKAPVRKVNFTTTRSAPPASAARTRRGEGRRATEGRFRIGALFDFATRAATPRRSGRIYAGGRYLGSTIVTFRRFRPGTIYVNTAEKALYYVLPGGRAIKYGVGVGRKGFTWKGRHRITMKKEWPEWRPPEEMKQREWKKYGRRLPDVMEGGPRNPLGARALYIGNTLYRIHGTNNPRTIGHNVSSGCIRMVNEEVIDLYRRVRIGAPVIVE